MTSPLSPTVEVLLADVSWVRGLARGLVRDAALADDAGQEAWLAALRRTRTSRSPLRGWLAGATRNAVLKARRSEGRRRAHEEIAAKAERTPSTAEVVEGISTQLAVAEAVHELEEPYRATILLRYYEDLSLKAIAVRMDAPVPTVAARVQRGLRMLQRVLERRLGVDGGNWICALLPLLERDASIEPRTPPTPLVATAGKAAILAAAIVAGGFGLRAILVRDAEPVPALVTRAALEESAVADVAPTGTELPVPDRATRRAAIGAASLSSAADDEAALSGSLLARIVDSDGTPAAELFVEVRHADALDPSRPVFRVRTGRHGRLTLDGLSPGEWVVAPALGGAMAVNVSASETASVTLHLPPGPALSGVVVDARGTPVPHAGVWLSLSPPRSITVDRLVQSTVADEFVVRADERGAFRLSTIGAARTVGARAAGHSPSPAYSLRERGGTELEMRLVLAGEGGSVSGVVSGPDGAPIAAAAILLDVGSTETSLPDGRRFTSSLPLVHARSDASGRFRVFGVRPGSRRLLVRAAGLAPWRGEVEVRGHDEVRVDVRLQRGLTVTGTITDAGGAPLEGVLVWAARRHWTAAPDPPHAIGTRTDPNGRYRLRGIEAGYCWITVDGGRRGRAAEVLVGGGERELVHDVSLTPGTDLRGRVLDADGTGLAGLSVRARRLNDWRSTGTITDEAGAFTIFGLGEHAYALRVAEGDVTLVRDLRVRPGDGETIIRVGAGLRPSARITGVVTEADGSAAALKGVRLERVGDDWTLELGVERGAGGTFRTHACPPGVWRVALRIAGHPDLPIGAEHTLAPHQVLDLGRIRLEPAGSLRLRFPPAMSGQLFDLGLNILDAEGRLVHDLRLAEPERHLPLTLPVNAGVLTVRAFAAGFAPSIQSVRVREHVVEPVELRLEPGTACTLRFHTVEGARDPARLRLLVRTESGDVLLERRVLRTVNAPDFPFVETIDLLAGVYEVEAGTQKLAAHGVLIVHQGVIGPPLDLLLEPRGSR